MKKTRKSPVRKKGTHTPTGASINEIALNLKMQNPALPLEEAKNQAKSLIKARETLTYGSGGATKYKILTHIFGAAMGKQIAMGLSNKDKEEEAASLLTSFSDKEKKSDRISAKDLKAIIKRLDVIDAEVKSLKIVKVSAPTPPPTPKAKAERSDAHAALNALGYSKVESTEMLKHAPEDASTEEQVRHALKPAAQRVPHRDIPAAVAEAKASIPVVTTPIETPKESAPKNQSDENKKEAASLKAETDNKIKQEKARKELFEKLDLIDEDVKKNRSKDWLTQLIEAVLGAFAIGLSVGNFFKNIIDNIIDKISGGIYKSLGDAIYGIVDKLQEKFPSIFGKSDKDKNIDRLKKQGYAFSRDEAVAKGKKTWVEANDAGISTIHSVDPPKQPKTPAKISAEQKAQAISPPTASVSTSAPGKIEQAATEKREIMAQAAAEASAPNITVVAPPPTMSPVSAQKEKEPFVLIKVRNDEPSQAAYVGSLFNHPVTKSGTSRI